MKLRIYYVIGVLTLGFLSCDEPVPYENSTFIYNPFSFQKDTLNIVESMEAGESDIDWGSQFRAWVGETQYYKSGISIDFLFADTALHLADVDSIQLQLRHQKTFPENGDDTLTVDVISYGFYETTDQLIDIENGTYGTFLGSDTLNVTNRDNFWRYTLVPDIIVEGDSSISLGIFPENTGVLSAVYGGGSVSRPVLKFFFHEVDTAGSDSVTFISYLADSVYVHLVEQPTVFDTTQFHYISQLTQDSLLFTINLGALTSEGDTIQHIISSSILPWIEPSASSLARPDSSLKFSMRVTEPLSKRNVDIELGADFVYTLNEIKFLVQSAMDDNQDQIELILRPNHTGYDPGFIAISKDVSKSALFVNRALVVQP